MQAEVSAVPTSCRSGTSWKGIDPKVGKSTRKGFEFANTTNATRSWFGSHADELMRVESAGGHAVTIGLTGAGRMLRPVAKGSTVTYRNAVEGADLSYEPGLGRVKGKISDRR